MSTLTSYTPACAQDSFYDLMTRLRAGGEDAAAELFQRYACRLVGLARSRISTWLQSKIDPEEVMASVFKSFFPRVMDGRVEMRNWDSLWGLLAMIATRKVAHKIEYWLSRARDPRREAPCPDGADWDVISSEPDPADVAALEDTVQRLLKGLNEKEKEIVRLRLDECTIEEISARVGRTERRVRRVLDRIKERLKRLRDSEAA